MSGLASLPWGIYVHVPWCRRRCPYCDFAFEVGASRGGFANAIATELRARRTEAPPSPARTLSLGGGTPTALASSEVAALIKKVRESAPLAPDAEISLEGNPEDVTAAYAKELAAAGVTRISLGVQSFCAETLKTLGRGHDAAMALGAVRASHDAGMAVGVDLIVGVPGDSPTRLESDLEVVRAEGVGHVSAYLLTIEEGTPWAKMIGTGRRRDVDDEDQADAYEHIQAALPALGLPQYEVSSYARPGAESEHNRLYWSKGHYLGLGPSAHSLHVDTRGQAHRRANAGDIDAYLAAPATAAYTLETIAPDDALLEAVSFGLRDLAAGVELESLFARHPPSTSVSGGIRKGLERAQAKGWVAITAAPSGNNIVRLTSLGARFADAVARELWNDDLVAIRSPKS